MNVFNTERTNILSVTYQLLDEINVKVNKSTIRKELESHPDYPGLLSICDCLAMLKVDNQVYRVENKDFDIQNLQFPFITHSSKAEGKFLLVKGLDDGCFILSDEKSRNRKITGKEFFSSWEGLVLYAEATADSAEPDFHKNYVHSFLRKITFPAFLFTLLSVIVLIQFSNTFNWLLAGLSTIKFIGLGISIILLAKSINADHSLIRSVCGSGQKYDCNVILQSEEAKITSWLSWSEVGFFYFSGSLLVILIFPVLVPVLSWINIITLPFTIYSLTYQYRTKKWCLLCCAVQGLLVAECILFSFIPGLFNTGLIHYAGLLIPLILCFFFPVVTWGLIKPVLLKASEAKSSQQQLNKFRHNEELFMLTLTNQQRYETDDELKPIILGNPQSQKIITIASNPFCEPCGRAHSFLDEWLNQRTDLQVQIILSIDAESSQLRIAQHMITLGLLNDKNIVRRALKDWYRQDKKVYESWSERYPVLIRRTAEVACLAQQRWSEEAEVIFTPAIFVNGYKLPELYQLEDLKYLII